MITKWLEYQFSNGIQNPKILLLDDFSAHWTVEVISTATRLNITLMKIPPGLTGISQPADISWNQPFKTQLRVNWSTKLLRYMQVMGHSFKAKAPSRNLLIEWISSAWENLSPDTIISEFVKPGIIGPTRENDDSNSSFSYDFSQVINSLRDFKLLKELGFN